jgi:hypothetical protein
MKTTWNILYLINYLYFLVLYNNKQKSIKLKTVKNNLKKEKIECYKIIIQKLI